MRSRTNSKASWSLVSVNCPGLGLIWTSDKLGVIFPSRESEERYLGKGSWDHFWGGFIRCGRQKVSWAGFWAKYLNLSPEPPSFPYLGKHPTSPNTRKVVQYPKSASSFGFNWWLHRKWFPIKRKASLNFQSVASSILGGEWCEVHQQKQSYYFISWSSKVFFLIVLSPNLNSLTI